MASKEGWDEKDAHYKPKNEEEADAEQTLEHLTAIGTTASGKGREQYHHHDGQHIFEDEHTHHQGGKTLLAEAHIVEGFVDDGGGTHGEHTGKEDAIHAAPTKETPHTDTEKHHAEDDGGGSNHGGYAHLQNLLKGEVESQGEE